MMTNLFFIFDPSISTTKNLNWISSFINLFYFPMTFWIFKSRLMKLFNIMIYKISLEMKIISYNKFNLSNSIFFISLFLMILLNNLMGLFPYIFTSSSHLIFSLSFSFPLWLSMMLFMWLKNLNHFFYHLIPTGTPYMLMPFMVLIETISNIIRPFTLSIRLTANMIAGHLLLTLMSQSAITQYSFLSFSIIIIQIILLILEFSVSIIQSYVFTILSILYTKETN